MVNKKTNRNYRHKVKQTFAAVCRRYNIRNRAVDKSDFYRICKGERIIPIRHPDKTQITGVYFRRNGDRAIYISEHLTADEWLWVAFHELGHHFMHQNQLYKQFFHRMTAKYLQAEAEANLFAELALKRKVEVKRNEK